MGRNDKHLPIACEGISFRRPILISGVIASALILWAGLAIAVAMVFGG